MTRILVADGNDELRQIISDTLEGWGYESDQVGTAEETLENATSQDYKLVIIDAEVAPEGVLASLRNLPKASPPAIPYVVLVRDERLEQEATAAGASFVLHKPYPPGALWKIVEHCAGPPDRD